MGVGGGHFRGNKDLMDHFAVSNPQNIRFTSRFLRPAFIIIKWK